MCTLGRDASSPTVYGWRGRSKISTHRPLLDDPAEVHDEHAVAELGDDAEVVRDQDQRQPVLGPQAGEQLR